MAFKNEIESCLEQIRDLENILQTASDKLNAVKQRLQTLEETRNDMPLIIKTEKEALSPVFLGDKISKTIYADLKKSMSLNDRFRFQRDLFENNAGLLDKVLDDLNNLSSLQETLDYLHSRFTWNWEDESVSAFKEIIEKRFV